MNAKIRFDNDEKITFLDICKKSLSMGSLFGIVATLVMIAFFPKIGIVMSFVYGFAGSILGILILYCGTAFVDFINDIEKQILNKKDRSKLSIKIIDINYKEFVKLGEAKNLKEYKSKKFYYDKIMEHLEFLKNQNKKEYQKIINNYKSSNIDLINIFTKNEKFDKMIIDQSLKKAKLDDELDKHVLNIIEYNNEIEKLNKEIVSQDETIM
jgi:hypothetical protein